MVRLKRLATFLILILICTVILAQKKRRDKDTVIPESQEDSVKLEAVLIDAEKQLILENYSKSLEGFTVALEMNSQSAVIHFKIAEVLAKSGEGQKAIPYGMQAIDLDSENKYYRMGLARIYQSIGFYIEAAKVYESMLTKFPSNEEALYELAELYQLTGRKVKMFEIFDRIELALGIKEEIIRERQRIYMKEGKLDEVIEEYKKLCDAYPNEVSYRLEMISFLVQNKKIEEAEKEISFFEMSESSGSRINLLKSEIAWLKGEHENSLTLLNAAFESQGIDFETKFQIVSNYLMASTDPNTKNELIGLVMKLADKYKDEFKAQAFAGDVLYQEGRQNEAVNYYLKAISLKPANYSVWQNILNVEAALNKNDSLIVHAERALEYFPNQALLYYFAGTGYLVEKNYKKAVRMLDVGKKYTTDPSLLTIFYGQLGDAYNGLKNHEQSFNSYQKALENDPNNEHVLNNYSYFLSLEKQSLDKALEMSTLLVKTHPNNATYLDTHGWVLYMVGEYKEAKKFIEQAISIDATDGTVLEHFGDVLFQLGSIDQAIDQWERALELGESSEMLEKKIADKKLYE